MTQYGSSTGLPTRRGGSNAPTARTRPSISGPAVFLDQAPRHYDHNELTRRCIDCGGLAVILLPDGCHPSCGHEARSLRNAVNKAQALATLRRAQA